MEFSGEFKNASYLFLKDLTDIPSIQTDLQLRSNDLIFDEFVNLFKLDQRSVEEGDSPIVLKEALKDFYRRYQPSLKVDIDNFTYDQLSIQNLVSGFCDKLECRAVSFLEAPPEFSFLWASPFGPGCWQS